MFYIVFELIRYAKRIMRPACYIGIMSVYRNSYLQYYYYAGRMLGFRDWCSLWGETSGPRDLETLGF